MSHRIMLIPIGNQVDLTKISNDLKKITESLKQNTIIFTPICQENKCDYPCVSLSEAETFLSKGKLDDLLELCVEKYEQLSADHQVIIIQGLIAQNNRCYMTTLNEAIAKAFDASIIFVADENESTFENIKTQMNILARLFGDIPNSRLLGAMIYHSQARFISKDIPILTLAETNWLEKIMLEKKEPAVTPPYFRHQLIEKAQKAQKRIVLPEGEEPRTIEAAIICAQRKIAKPILIGNLAKIREIAKQKDLVLNNDVEILEPLPDVIEKYVNIMVELRKSKGLTVADAREQLQDHVVLGTMMLKQGEVDGLVSGAIHTTANTIRPALQFIKTKPGIKIVSSIFFMCLPEQVLVCGDCAVNPNPTAEELADIAIESAVSAKTFGIEPRVAMISYSTGTSGTGPDVDFVCEATRIAKEKRPDLLIDGPLQYDAAIVKSVGKQKSPNSPVAGQATVLIFPDLNTGNTTYKAIQRSAKIVAIGPMLQGLNKPVNDLSRGCLVEDIVFTIALTVIQAI